MKASEIRNYLSKTRPEILDFLDNIYLGNFNINPELIKVVEQNQAKVVDAFLYYVPNNDGNIRIKTLDDLLSYDWSDVWGNVIHGYCLKYQKTIPWYRKIVGSSVTWLVFKVSPALYQEATIYRALLDRLANR